MKKIQIIFTLFLLVICCNPILAQLNGRYDYKGYRFNFKDDDKSFEYFLFGEMSILKYSTGSWILNKNKIYLTGLNEDNLKILNVTHDIKTSNDRTNIQIHYIPENTYEYIKLVILVNNSEAYMITKDTVLYPTHKVETIQVRSYLSKDVMLSSNVSIDTLSSRKIHIAGQDNENKEIVLKFAVHLHDFSRVKYTGMLRFKRGNIWGYYNKIKFVRNK